MYRLTLLLAVALTVGCASSEERTVEPPPNAPTPLSPDPRLRNMQATGALVDKALGTEKKEYFLKGTCELTIGESQLTRPCPALTVVASDPSGEPVGTAVVERGKFSIRVPAVEDYYLELKLEEKNYMGEDANPLGPFRPEDSILIRVNRTQP